MLRFLCGKGKNRDMETCVVVRRCVMHNIIYETIECTITSLSYASHQILHIICT